MQPDKAQEIVRLISEEGQSLRQAAKSVGITAPAFNQWCHKNPDLALQYASAREDRSDYLVEDALKIADDPKIDPAQKRIMVDTRKWFASKLNAKRYGDKVDVNHGGQTGNPVKVVNLLPKAPQPDE